MHKCFHESKALGEVFVVALRYGGFLLRDYPYESNDQRFQIGWLMSLMKFSDLVIIRTPWLNTVFFKENKIVVTWLAEDLLQKLTANAN